jgi:folate-binding protein YgfZ
MTSPAEPPDARRTAAFADRSDRGKIVVAGGDRRSYLHAMFTNDVAGLTGGRGCYTAYLTPQGRMVADLRVADLGDVLLLDLDRSVKDAVIEKLDQFIFSEDVQLGDVTDTFAEFVLAGPASAEVLGRLLADGGAPAPDAAALAALAEFDNLRIDAGGAPLIVVASRELADRAFDLYVERPRAGAFRAALIAAGAGEMTPDAAETLRVERGRPVFPRDMDAETIPLEAGIEHRAISFTKGCYPGQEVITRVLHRGHGRVARKLVGLRLDGPVVPVAGDRIEAAGREVGRVTSAVASPAVGQPIALGYVHRDFTPAGTPVHVVHDGAPIPATVCDLPFVP